MLEVALETAEQLGLSDRLTTVAGNYHELNFPAAQFDLVMLANVTHLETPEGNGHLIDKARQALKPHGHIAVVDVFAGQSHGDLNRSLYALGLAMRTQQGRMYSRDELTALMRDSGFGTAQFFPLDVPPYILGILLAQR